MPNLLHNGLGGLLIRDATAADSEAIMALTVRAYEPYAAVIGPEWWTGYRAGLPAALFEDSAARRIVAESAGLLVGSVLFYPGSTQQDTGSARVRLLAVDPAARGRGVGGALMEECVCRARAEGAAALRLHTMEPMVVAQRMYERMGFQRQPDDDFQPVPGVTVLGYQLDLTTPDDGDR